MKITEKQLRRVIAEEVSRIVAEYGGDPSWGGTSLRDLSGRDNPQSSQGGGRQLRTVAADALFNKFHDNVFIRYPSEDFKIVGGEFDGEVFENSQIRKAQNELRPQPEETVEEIFDVYKKTYAS